MAEAQRVLVWLRSNYQGCEICDDCLAEVTGIERRAVSTIAKTLVDLFPNEFTRRKTSCLECNSSREKWVTLYKQDAPLQPDALSSIKRNAEQYLRESKKAAKALGRLSESLGVLKALGIHKQT